MFEEDAILPSNNDLLEISQLAKQQLSLQDQVATAEQALEALQRALRQVQEIDLPQAMLQAGVSSITLPTGQKITIKESLSVGAVSPKSQHYAAALQWLRDNNFGDVIKNEVKVLFGKGEEEGAMELVQDLKQHGWNNYEQLVTVHSQTIKSLITEQLARGKDVPLEIFGAYPVTKALIKTA